jgi:excinuclease ABC subunit A
MQFLSDIFVLCPDCEGARFRPEVLEVTYKGKTIAEVLQLTVTESLDFFRDTAAIPAALRPLAEVGLDYIRLGQPLNTLSGGESQRLKLASHMVLTGQAKRLLIFDEPTTGLHFEDIRKLLGAFDRLLAQGHSLLVIEHNMEVIKSADYLVDLGPEGGDAGGRSWPAARPRTSASARSPIRVNFYVATCGETLPRPIAWYSHRRYQPWRRRIIMSSPSVAPASIT